MSHTHPHPTAQRRHASARPRLAIVLAAVLVTALAWSLASARVGSAARGSAAPSATVKTLFAFDTAKAEYPESIAYRDGFAYVTYFLTGQVVRIAPQTGERSPYAQLPVAPGNFTLGLAFDRAGALFVAVAAPDLSDTAAVAAAGVYRVPAGGGAPALWASGTDTLKYPSGLGFDPQGNVYVSDALAGTLYRFGPAGAIGTAKPWASGPLLAPDATVCATDDPFVLGANGVVAGRHAVWVANSVQGKLVHIPVGPGGTAGAPRVAASDCATLQGIDGLHRDPRRPRAAFLAANNYLNSVVSVRSDGAVSVLASGKPPFRTPVDLAALPAPRRTARILVINLAGAELLANNPAEPALLEVALPPYPASVRGR